MAKARRANKVRLLGVVRRKRAALMMTTALQATVMLVLSQPAGAQPAPNARPTGGSVVAGGAAISRSTSNTQIDQSSQRAAIDWKSFNVGSQQSVTFNQPSASSVTLNRVTGPDPSRIAGRIDANGQIILTNQSGVTFYKGAQVNANGLLVTASGISNQNFMAGAMTFDQPAHPNAKVDNQGNITIKQAGLAALVAPRVANSGTITATLGHVVLAGAKTTTIDLYGDGMLSLDVTNQVTQTPVGRDGKAATALVTNTGTIIADGGTVQLTARAADGIVQNLVQAGGKIRAATMGDQTGTVALNGVGGSIVVEGQLSAPGYAPRTRGGNIEVATTGNVVVASTAKINASGKAGGGNIGIGTSLDRVTGGPNVTPTVVAANTTISKGATIKANATQNGDGGRIVVLSNLVTGTTRMDGLITAKGGALDGDGGFVEVSGGYLGMTTGMIDVSASRGRLGNILFDPQDLDIVAAGADDGNVTATGVDVGAPDQNTNITISASKLTALSGNLLIEASRNLTVDAALAFTNQIAGTSVTMLAGKDLTVNQAISTKGGDLILTAAKSGFAHTDATGTLTINADVGSATTGNITLSAGSGGIIQNAGNIITPVVADLTTTGAVNQAGVGVISAGTLQSTGGITGTVSLNNANTIGTVAAIAVGGDFSLSDAKALSVNGALNATSGNVFLESSNAGGITIAATGQVNAGAAKRASFQSKFLTIDPGGGAITGGTLEFGLDTPGALTLGTGGSLSSLSGVTTGNVVIGGVTPPGGSFTISATSITTVATFDGNNRPVALNTSGAITEGAGDPIINLATLSGTAASVNLNAANAIANIGSFTASSGTFLMTDGGLAGTLTVSGPLTSITNDVTLSGAPALNVTGSIGAAGTVSLNSVEIDLSAGANVTGPTVKLNAGATGITFTGNASIGQSGGIVDINSAGTVSEVSTAVIIAGTLESTGGISGDAGLLGTANAIDNLGNIPLSPGVNFALVDGSSLNVTGTAAVTGASKQLSIQSPGISISATGTLSADNASGLVSLRTDTFANSGAIGAATVELAPNTTGRAVTLGGTVAGSLSLASLSGFTTGNLIVGAVTPPGGSRTTTAGSITIGGTFDATGVSTVTLDATGAVTQSAPLIGGSQVFGKAGSFTLLNSGNKFADVGLTATAGDIQVSDSTSVILSASSASGNFYLAAPSVTQLGAVSAAGVLGLQTDAYTFTLGSLKGTTVELAPLTSGLTETLGAAGGLSLLSSAFIGKRGKTRGGGAQTGWPRQRMRWGKYGMIGWRWIPSRSPR